MTRSDLRFVHHGTAAVWASTSRLLQSLRATLLPLETLNAVPFQLGENVYQHTASKRNVEVYSLARRLSCTYSRSC